MGAGLRTGGLLAGVGRGESALVLATFTANAQPRRVSVTLSVTSADVARTAVGIDMDACPSTRLAPLRTIDTAGQRDGAFLQWTSDIEEEGGLRTRFPGT